MKERRRPPPSWEEFRAYRAAPRQPAPEHGIKVRKLGSTWWGQRWIEALQRLLQGDAGRLGRGRTYARAGRVHDLAVHAGKVSARVTGTRPAPYEVSIELPQLGDEVWRLAILGMAAQAQFSAQLLAGEMPQAIDEAFRAAGATLFPEQPSELVTSCSCPDWGDPCKHVAATHYVLGEAFDQDPFLLFELRGRTREQVLAALRQARTPSARGAASPEPVGGDAAQVAGVALGALDVADYDRARAPLPALQFSFEAPRRPAAVLSQLGSPAVWRGEDSPAEALAPLVQRAAEAARRIALAEPELTAEAAEEKAEAAAEVLSPAARATKPRRKTAAFRPRSRSKKATRRARG